MDEDAEVDFMLAEFGVDVTIAGVTAPGVRDTADREVLEALGLGAMFGKVIEVRVRVGALPGLALEAAATVAGVPYKVARILQEGDGRLARVLMAVEV